MKRLTLCFFVAVFCAINAFGAGDVTISRVIPGKTNVEKTNTTTESKENTVNRSARRTSVSRNTRTTSDTVSRGNGQKNTVNVVSRGTKKNITNRPTLEEGVSTVGRNARTEAASINNVAAVRRAGVTLRATTAEVGGRAKIIGTDAQTGSNIDETIRGVQGRASILSSAKKQQVTPTAESITKAKDVLEKTADLNNTCQQQYNECMDQFCAVVDANQKRCSCSANLARYAKVQQAVEDANAELNEVAQNIRYVGLSADEIRAIMNATEAEVAMSKTKDTTQTRNMLDDIAEMIKDPSSSSSYSYSSSVDLSGLLDMEFDFSDDSDLFGLDLFSTSKDISSKRGKELYKEATKRCKSVLNQCKDAGGTADQITGNYDLAIDKDCIEYEQGLEKLNQQLVSNVRSANLMLQKARLAVLENKNQYDIRGCIGALENCMLDDMVCGENYLKCLDPTKVYIDENGNVVLGRNIANITAFTQLYNNAQINAEFIKASATDTTCANADGGCIVNYLMKKIGRGQSTKEGGLCRAVLDKCQDYTYVSSNNKVSNYDPYNEVVVNYIQRALVNIKAAQAKIISDYASTCLSDIADCYNQQVTQINALSTTANANSVYNVMTGACYNVALTCGYAVFAYDPDVGMAMGDFRCSTCRENHNCSATGDCPACAGCLTNEDLVDKKQKTYLIQQISDLFYQSLLCPSNSTFVQDMCAEGVGLSGGRSDIPSGGTGVVQYCSRSASPNRTIEGYANVHCKCNEGYTVWGGSCVATCEINQYRNNLGSCITCDNGYSVFGATEIKEGSSCASCPENSDYVVGYHNVSDNLAIAGYVSTSCQCQSGYTVWNGLCLETCAANKYRDDNGNCVTCNGEFSAGNSLTEGTCSNQCPLNSVYSNLVLTPSANLTIGGNVSAHCKCDTGYSVWEGQCKIKCGHAQYRDEYGECVTCEGVLENIPSGMDPDASNCNITQG